MDRGSVVTPQVLVVVTCAAHYEAYNVRTRRRGPKDASRLPVGNKDDFSLMKGELAFGYTNGQFSMSSHTSNPRYQAEKVFTAFNGLSPKDKIRFMGTVDKGWEHGQGSGDTAVTIRHSGTATIINTGPATIHQGSLVYWDFPRPVRIQGRNYPPATVPGIPQTKYMAVVRGNFITDVESIFQNIPPVNGSSDKLNRYVEEHALMRVDPGTADEEKGPNAVAGAHSDDPLVKAVEAIKKGDYKKVASAVAEYTALLHSRAIGVALSTARQGEPLDVQMGYFF